MEEKNAKNLAKVNALVEKAEQIKLGGDLKKGVVIDYTSLFGTEYKGTVIFKRPTMQDYIKMGAIKSEYLRGAGVIDMELVDVSIKRMAQVMAVLSVVIVKCPDWLLDLNGVVEPDLLYHVSDKYDVWENSFRKPSAEESDGDSEATK